MDNIDRLRLALEDKLQKEWDPKWIGICNYQTEKINRRAKFYEALAAEISKETNISVSRDTVQRFNKGEGGHSKSSLQAFSRYVGYKSLEDFEKTNKTSKSHNNRLISFIGLAILLAIGGLVYNYLIFPFQQKNEIIKVVESANQRQFESFNRLNLADSVRIDSFYTYNGSARKSILTLIRQSQKNNRRIDLPADNPSYFKIHDIRVIELSNNKAIVKTKEHWFLKWFDQSKQKYTVSYDHENEQLYELEVQNGKWKIKNNYFEGKATSIDF